MGVPWWGSGLINQGLMGSNPAASTPTLFFAPAMNAKEEFVRHLGKVVRGAIIDVAKMHGELLPESVAKRVAAQLWAQGRSPAHADDAVWVRYVRGMLGLTQRELARKLRTTQVTIARWEGGVSRPSQPFRLALEKLARQAAVKRDASQSR